MSSPLRAGVDAWVGQGQPTRNHSATVNLQLGNDPNDVNAYAYIYFQRPAPKGATITEAVLRLYSRDAWPTTDIIARRLMVSWKASQITWNNRPDQGGGALAPLVITVTPAVPAPFTLIEIPITRFVQAWCNGAPNYGIRLAAPSAAGRLRLVSLNAGSHKPTMTVDWSDAPQTPTNLVPSGGQAFSIPAPTLQFQYIDTAGNTDLANVHVQLAGDATTLPVWSGAGSNVHWDSGPQPATEPELDLSDTLANPPAMGANPFGGFNPDMVRYWRVRVQDGAGLWSRWSARGAMVGAKMVRLTKGTLNLLSPTGGEVHDFTPAISWSLTGGRTPARVRYRIVNPTDPTIHYVDTGQRKASLDRDGNVYTHTVSHQHRLTRWDRLYRLILDVWDTEDRVTTPGDPAYYRVVHDFRLVQGMIGAPTDLSGTSDPDGRPFMHLRWHSAYTPDEWRIFRGDELVYPQHEGTEGADLLGADGWYRWTDREARPNIAHQWGVRALAEDTDAGHEQRLSPITTWTGTINNYHAWLVDWDPPPGDPDRLIAILDPDVSFEEPDLSATYEPINRNRVVRVAQVHRGMQGTVSGRVIEINDALTLHDQIQNFYWMKAHPTKQFRLFAGNRSWRVLLGDMVLTPMRIPKSVASVISFSFWSTHGPEVPIERGQNP